MITPTDQKAKKLSDSLPARYNFSTMTSRDPRGPLTSTKNDWDYLLNMMYLMLHIKYNNIPNSYPS